MLTSFDPHAHRLLKDFAHRNSLGNYRLSRSHQRILGGRGYVKRTGKPKCWKITAKGEELLEVGETIRALEGMDAQPVIPIGGVREGFKSLATAAHHGMVTANEMMRLMQAELDRISRAYQDPEG